MPVKMINPKRMRRNKTMIISEDRKAWLSEKIKWNYSIFGTLPLDALVCVANIIVNDITDTIEVDAEYQYKLVNKNGKVSVDYIYVKADDEENPDTYYDNFNEEPHEKISVYNTYAYRNIGINGTVIISLNKDDRSIDIKGKTEYSVVENMRNEINTISNECNIKDYYGDEFTVVIIFPLVKSAPLVRIYGNNDCDKDHYIDFCIVEPTKEYIEQLKRFDDKNCFFNSLSLKSEYRKTIVSFENPLIGYPMSYNGKVDDILKVLGNENFYEKENKRVLETKDGFKISISNKNELSYNNIIISDIYRENKESFVQGSAAKSDYIKEIDKILEDIQYQFIESCKDFISKTKTNPSTFVDIDNSTNYIKGCYHYEDKNYNSDESLIVEIFDNKILKCLFASSPTVFGVDNDTMEVSSYSLCIVDLENNRMVLSVSGSKLNKDNKSFKITSQIGRLGGVFIYEKYINDANGDTILKSDSIDGSFIVHLASMDSNIITKIEKFESPIYSLNDDEIYIRDEYSVPKKYIISDEARNNTI